MKIKKLMMTACVATATLTLPVTSVQALTSIQVQEIKRTVLSVPVPEMPAKAAEIVVSAQKKDRQAVAITAVRAVLSKHRAAAPLVISAVSRVAPEVAPAVAVAAAELNVEQAVAIARAAALSAPSQAPQIAAAVSKAVPSQAQNVAAVVTPTVVATRGAAANQGGNIRIEKDPIDEDENFPLNPPVKTGPPQVLYNTPPAQ